MIYELINKSVKAQLSPAIISNKIKDIKTKVNPIIWKKYYKKYENIINSKSHNNLQFLEGPCHGDLTFSNVMFSIESPQIGLIDFLDNFIETPFFDIIKIRQDIKLNWTSKFYTKDHDRVKIQIINNKLDQILIENFSQIINSNSFELLEILNYLRLAPYVKNDFHPFLSSALESLTEIN